MPERIASADNPLRSMYSLSRAMFASTVGVEASMLLVATSKRSHQRTYRISKIRTPVRSYGPCFIPGGRQAYIPFVNKRSPSH